MIKTSQRMMGILQFVGTSYQGWQTQKKGTSIQERVEQAFAKILNQPIHVYGASRTDAGVHARGFVFHFDASTTLSVETIHKGFNRLIEDAIHLKSLKVVSNQFTARFQHSLKTYRYQILTGERDPFLKAVSWYVPNQVDWENVKQASALFVGKHHFQNFTTKKEDALNFVRTITAIKVITRGRLQSILITGDGFMTYMVRMIVGSLLAYGQGKITFADLQLYLQGKLKGPVSFKAPPQGLCLEKVRYEKKT